MGEQATDLAKPGRIHERLAKLFAISGGQLRRLLSQQTSSQDVMLQRSLPAHPAAQPAAEATFKEPTTSPHFTCPTCCLLHFVGYGVGMQNCLLDSRE